MFGRLIVICNVLVIRVVWHVAKKDESIELKQSREGFFAKHPKISMLMGTVFWIAATIHTLATTYRGINRGIFTYGRQTFLVSASPFAYYNHLLLRIVFCFGLMAMAPYLVGPRVNYFRKKR